jgi:hypothetical protein
MEIRSVVYLVNLHFYFVGWHVLLYLAVFLLIAGIPCKALGSNEISLGVAVSRASPPWAAT